MSIKNLISLSTAGGGKTTKLIKRINEINNYSKTLVISFTKASCKDIFKRSGVDAQTLHSFCFNFLPNKMTIEENIKKFTSIFIGDFFYLNQLGIDQVNRLLNSYFISKQFPENLDFLEAKDRILNDEFKKLVELIESEKEKHNVLFFSDIIHSFLKEFREYLFDISNIYDHILIDEAQDLSELQLEIVYTLITEVFMEENKSFFIVGDVKQSIYGFQGSSPVYYLEFLEKIQQQCKLRGIELQIENNQKTYRFGGDILKKINEKFESHESEKAEGFYYHIRTQDIEQSVLEIVEKHLDEDIMILFEKNNKMVEKIQNQLADFGLNIKLYLSNNPIIESLNDILGYLQTTERYYAARILQGCFFHLDEPHFFYLNQLEKLEEYNIEFFEKIKSLRFEPHKLIEFLSTKIYTDNIGKKLMEYLYDLSFSYQSLDSFLMNLPDTAKLEKDGILFSTIHSSKGLEADIVILLPEKKSKEHMFVNLDPFFFFKDINDNNKKYIEENSVKDLLNKNNLNYVALTRSRKYLYEISFEDDLNF